MYLIFIRRQSIISRYLIKDFIKCLIASATDINVINHTGVRSLNDLSSEKSSSSYQVYIIYVHAYAKSWFNTRSHVRLLLNFLYITFGLRNHDMSIYMSM